MEMAVAVVVVGGGGSWVGGGRDMESSTFKNL